MGTVASTTSLNTAEEDLNLLSIDVFLALDHWLDDPISVTDAHIWKRLFLTTPEIKLDGGFEPMPSCENNWSSSSVGYKNLSFNFAHMSMMIRELNSWIRFYDEFISILELLYFIVFDGQNSEVSCDASLFFFMLNFS